MTRSALVFRVAARVCALPLEVVVETMRPLPIDAVPGAVEPTLGMAIIRGTPTVVLDAGRLLENRPATSGRYITLRVGQRTVALAVDEVLGVRGLPEDIMVDLPPLLAGSSRLAVERVAMLDGELAMVLGTARLVPDELIPQLERSA